MKVLSLIFAALALAPASASAKCGLLVEDAYIPEPPPATRIAAAYFSVTNECDSKVVLVGVEANATHSLSLHRTTTEGGVAKMEPVERLPIASGETVVFKPGGLHVMIRGPRLSRKQSFPFDLLLEGRTRVRVLADVVSRRRPAAQKHDQLHHSGRP